MIVSKPWEGVNVKYIFLYNPNCGVGSKKFKINQIIKKLIKNHINFSLYATTSLEDTILKAKDSCGKCDVLVFAGGDGTFNNVVNGICQEKNRPILGYIPLGTCNDMARNINIPVNYKKALKCILDGTETTTIDIGTINDQYFDYVAAIGTFTKIPYVTKRQIKKALGVLSYYIVGAKELFNMQYIHVDLTIDGETFHEETPLVMILNSKRVAGILCNEESDNQDGLFDVFIFKPDRMKGFLHFFDFFIWKKKNDVIHRKGKTIDVHIHENDNAWCVDGEEGPTTNQDLHIEVVPKAITLFTKKK